MPCYAMPCCAMLCQILHANLAGVLLDLFKSSTATSNDTSTMFSSAVANASGQVCSGEAACAYCNLSAYEPMSNIALNSSLASASALPCQSFSLQLPRSTLFCVSHRVVLEALPPEVEAVLEEHNVQALDDFVTYVQDYICANADALPPANVLPLSKLSYPMVSEPIAGQGNNTDVVGGALRDLQKHLLIASPFVALSGAAETLACPMLPDLPFSYLHIACSPCRHEQQSLASSFCFDSLELKQQHTVLQGSIWATRNATCLTLLASSSLSAFAQTGPHVCLAASNLYCCQLRQWHVQAFFWLVVPVDSSGCSLLEQDGIKQ